MGVPVPPAPPTYLAGKHYMIYLSVHSAACPWGVCCDPPIDFFYCCVEGQNLQDWLDLAECIFEMCAFSGFSHQMLVWSWGPYDIRQNCLDEIPI